MDYRTEAISAFEAGDHLRAIDLFTRAFNTCQSDYASGEAAAVISQIMDDKDRAVLLLEAVLKRAPSAESARARLAKLLWSRQHFTRARHILIPLGPESLRSLKLVNIFIDSLIECRAYPEAAAALSNFSADLKVDQRLWLLVKLQERMGDHAGVIVTTEFEPLELLSEKILAALGRAHLSMGNLDEALKMFECVASQSQAARTTTPEMSWSVGKLQHDRDLAAWLATRSNDVDVRDVAEQRHRMLAAALLNQPKHGRIPFSGPISRELDWVGEIWHRPSISWPGKAMSTRKDWAQVAETVRQDGLAVLDNYLCNEALLDLRRDLTEGAIWFNDGYEKGYLATDLETGLASALLLKIISETHSILRSQFTNCAPSAAWAFKYGPQVQGVDPHADFSHLTLNLWLAPDDANKDQSTGGLVFWPKKAPHDASFFEYNSDAKWLNSLTNDAAPCNSVPHRCNRAILFDSALLHASDHIDFVDSHEMRRLNLTLAFGFR